MMEPTPVYICTGFLDSGKTLLVKDTLMEQEWIEPDRWKNTSDPLRRR